MQPWHGLTLLHLAAVTCGLLLYVVLTHSGRQQRTPTAALAWVIALLTFPYLALPVYLLLGTRKLAHPHATASDPARTGVAATCGLDLPPARHCRAVQLHSAGAPALSALLALLTNAQRSIDIEMFLIRDDAVGRAVLAALASAVQRGVRVRVLLDGLGAYIGHRQIAHALRGNGIELRWFSPLRLRLRPQFGRGNLRNHRKLLLIDGHTLWSGGRNLAREYFLETPDTPAWCDLSFIIEDGVVADAAAGFAADWALAGGENSAAEMPSASSLDGPLAQLLPSGPDRRDDTAHALYVNAIHRADARVLIASPYFVPDDALQLALLLAARRGVQVELLLPARSNHRLADIARHRSLRALVSAGVHVHLLPQMLHAKLAVVDAQFASCGSINFDGRSLFLNYELNVLFFDAVQIDALADWFARQRTQATRYAVQVPGWWRDVGEGLVRAVGFQL